MPVEHVIFIPGVLLIGTILGYVLGARAARADRQKRKKRALE